ncbi:MAG: murein L,D-transpeptidase catalytic domain family protein [Gammaproteobacteria bacterium]
MNFIKNTLFTIIFSTAALLSLASRADALLISSPDKEAKLLSAKTHNELNARVIRLGINAYNNGVRRGVVRRKLLAIVDYSKPSTVRRFWIFDLTTHKILYHELVAHGVHSGGKHVTSFSNAHNSHKSSIGIYVTERTYQGKHNYSLRLRGLERGYNDNVKSRGVVIHSSHYVTNDFIRVAGQLGRSHGCLAINPRVTRGIIDTIKNGTIIMVYHPDTTWASRSVFLKSA